LLSIVTDILSISAIEAGQETVKIEKVNVHSLLNEQLNVFQPRTNEKKLSLSIKKFSNEVPKEIYTDGAKLTQVFSNLISNALKFTHQGGIELGCNKTDDKLKFFVKDTGIGINQDNLVSIFDRFVQADETISINYGGTGLGLPICKGLVELLGGRIWVESEKGKGATFIFTVPCKAVT